MTKTSAAVALTVLSTSSVLGQSSVPSVNLLQAISGARIEVGDGRVIENGNVVMRQGVLVAVGPNAPIPAGAEILDGKGLTVYPGFIDAYTSRGLNLPAPIRVPDETPARADYTPAFMPAFNRKGISPEILAARYFQPTDEVLRPYRSSGFTTALVVPPGYIGGVASLMNLGGRTPAQSTLHPTVGMGFAFTGVSEQGYPNSLLGAIAQMRQALADSAQYLVSAQVYESGGTQRPPYDEGLISLASRKGDWAFFDASTAAQVDRTLMISDEFGLRPALVGASEAWRRLDEIKGRSIPVIVALGFGPEPMAPKPQPNQGDDPGDPENIPERTEERRRLFLESLRNVRLLTEAGVPVSLSTKGNRNQTEFMANVRRAVSDGWSREAALKALTINPATMFGLQTRLGTVEVGKIANLTVMTGDFLDEKTKVKMLYIDGRRIDPAASPAAATPRGRFGEGDDK